MISHVSHLGHLPAAFESTEFILSVRAGIVLIHFHFKLLYLKIFKASFQSFLQPKQPRLLQPFLVVSVLWTSDNSCCSPPISDSSLGFFKCDILGWIYTPADTLLGLGTI